MAENKQLEINQTDPAAVSIDADGSVAAFMRGPDGSILVRIWETGGDLTRPPAVELRFRDPAKIVRWFGVNYAGSKRIYNELIGPILNPSTDDAGEIGGTETAFVRRQYSNIH
jgi:hypothetical protein